MPTSSSLRRGLAVLTAVAAEGESTAAAIAESTGLAPSTIYRYLSDLLDTGFLEQTGYRYRLGRATAALNDRLLVQSRLREVAPGLLIRISAATGEAVSLMMRSGDRAFVVARADQPGVSRHSYDLQEVLPLHAGAGQRLLLAWAPRAIQHQVMEGDPVRFTGRTPPPTALPALLAQARRDGYTVSRAEVEEGAISVAVPVRHAGEVVAALDLASTQGRGAVRWLRQVRTELDRAAEELGTDLTVWSRQLSQSSARVAALSAPPSAAPNLLTSPKETHP